MKIIITLWIEENEIMLVVKYEKMKKNLNKKRKKNEVKYEIKLYDVSNC